MSTNHWLHSDLFRKKFWPLQSVSPSPLPSMSESLRKVLQVISGHCTLTPTLVALLAMPELCRPCSSHCFSSIQVSSQPVMHREWQVENIPVISSLRTLGNIEQQEGKVNNSKFLGLRVVKIVRQCCFLSP